MQQPLRHRVTDDSENSGYSMKVSLQSPETRPAKAQSSTKQTSFFSQPRGLVGFRTRRVGRLIFLSSGLLLLIATRLFEDQLAASSIEKTGCLLLLIHSRPLGQTRGWLLVLEQRLHFWLHYSECRSMVFMKFLATNECSTYISRERSHLRLLIKFGH